jgi:tetratricopeptide (TPR) repeat protein
MRGNAERAILEARKAIELDPLYAITHWVLGICFCVSRQYDKALREIQQARKMMGSYLPLLWLLVDIFVIEEMFEVAMDETNKGLEIFPENPVLFQQKARIYVKKGEKEKTQKILDELIERSEKEYVTPFAIASLYAELGEIDNAYEYLEMAYKRHDMNFPFFTMLYRGDARFNAFFKKIGL